MTNQEPVMPCSVSLFYFDGSINFNDLIDKFNEIICALNDLQDKVYEIESLLFKPLVDDNKVRLIRE
jgi:hypothetical protein